MTEIQYPIDDMVTARHDLHMVLDTQWSKHTALFLTNHDSFSSLIKVIAIALPNGATKVQELEQALNNYHQRYQAAYEALYELADRSRRPLRQCISLIKILRMDYSSSRNPTVMFLSSVRGSAYIKSAGV